ncbi:hypothetical protein F7Q99_36160 [Streptomyces kaniharaensis]|uniref:Uncharacterized protein n=1 Tax=Streptomyces kaniharaensis TaxID=212423 RepID=A0A6N7L3U0_9ACTN|nr:hypothetical protein [Streptomyces kaniharaensis]MQS17477.1 hypothetical protein [Streptomyces kaniharaensis]
MSVTFEPESIQVQWDDPHSLNFNNGNAAEVLRLLGYDAADPYGNDDAVGFLGRVLLALGLLVDDDARPEVTDGRWTCVGRREGYLSARLGELHAMAEHCVAHGLRVRWH